MSHTIQSVYNLTSIFYNMISYMNKAKRNLDSNDKLPKNLRNQYIQEYSSKFFNKLKIKTYCKNHSVLNEAGVFVGNHISYLDIPLLLKYQQASFVAKKELSKWPIIGNACKFSDTIFVDRKNATSRKLSYLKIAHKVKDENESVAIFPSGTTSLSQEPKWRWGAFRLADEFNIPIIPFRIRYNQPKKAAFIGDDSLIPHMWSLMHEKSLEASIEFAKPIFINDVEHQTKIIQSWCQDS